VSRLIKAVKAGVRGALSGKQPSRFTAADIVVSCPHCKSDQFVVQEAQLSTAWAAFLNVDWADRTGWALACARCGLIQWFARKPEPGDESGVEAGGT